MPGVITAFKGLAHDRSATQNRTPFLLCFKYTLRNFNPYFAQKWVKFSLKKKPPFLALQVHVC